MSENKESEKAPTESTCSQVGVERLVRHFNDFGFTAVARPHEYRVEYEIYEHEGIECESGKPLFHKAGSPSSPDPVETIGESEVFAHGDVKWDGCSNWYFDEQDRCMLHGCSKEDLLNIGNIMAACWEWTKEICPNWLD